jgi:hypothetical protein
VSAWAIRGATCRVSSEADIERGGREAGGDGVVRGQRVAITADGLVEAGVEAEPRGALPMSRSTSRSRN